MPVNTPHPLYTKAAIKWSRCRDCIGGEDEIKEAGTKYLDPLEGMIYEDDRTNNRKLDKGRYERFKKRASFWPATWRTYQVYRGMVFRKPPIIELPPDLQMYAKNITQTGRSLEAEIRRSFSEILKVGRYGVLVDHPEVVGREDGVPLTMSEAESLDLRPYVATYTAENIVSWEMRRFGNVSRPARFVLREQEFVKKADDEFAYEYVTQFRVLELNETETGSLVYTQQIWRHNAESEIWYPDPEGFRVPVMHGQPLDYIPFYLYNPADSDTLDPDEPPLNPIATENLAHYMISAWHRTAMMYCAGPMSIITGVPHVNENSCDEMGNKIEPIDYEMGPGIVWHFAETDADVKMHEPNGDGTPIHERELARIAHNMAVLGARGLENDKRAAESTETNAMHRQGEYSALADMARYCGDLWVNVLEKMQEWSGSSGNIQVDLNTDYLPAKITASDLQALSGAWMAGAISWRTVYENLQRGEIANPERTADEEQELIEEDGARKAENMPSVPDQEEMEDETETA